MKSKRATSQDVAQRAGVSRTTVSFVLNEVEANISPETRQRVLQAAEELGFVPDASARALARKRTHTFGLVLIREASHLASDAFLPSVIQGVVDVIRPEGFRLLLEPVASADEPDIYLNLVRARCADAILLSGPRSDDQQLVELIESGFPVILLGQLPGSEAYSVDVDNRRSARVAVEHLIELGHRRIGCVTNAPLAYTAAADRLAGYQDALAAHGLPLDEALVRYGDFGPESGRTAARSLLTELSEPPTALFVASDVVAMGALGALRELGLSIPDDVALVGFDDVPAARYLAPPLTTVRLPAIELGRRAGEMLLCSTNGNRPTQRQVALNTELIVRGSSRRPL
jgi:LacI family transcriptional regulator